MLKHFKYLLALSAIASAVPASADVAFDFETSGQYAGNFRKLTGNGNPAQTGLGADNDYVTMTGTTAATLVYDTTPADGTDKSTFTVAPGSALRVSADLRVATNTSSVGVYIVDPNNEASGLLALFNVNDVNSNVDERIRFWSGSTPNTGGAGTTRKTTTGNTVGLNEYVNAVFTYSVNENNNPVLTLTAGSLSDSFTFTDITTPLTTVEVAFRLSSQNPPDVAHVDLDNVSIAVVPEPASLGLIGGAALLLTRRRRSRA